MVGLYNFGFFSVFVSWKTWIILCTIQFTGIIYLVDLWVNFNCYQDVCTVHFMRQSVQIVKINMCTSGLKPDYLKKYLEHQWSQISIMLLILLHLVGSETVVNKNLSSCVVSFVKFFNSESPAWNNNLLCTWSHLSSR